MDLYKILQVPSDADVATIEKAFRKLSIKLHPDKANVSTIPSGHVETREEKEAREQRNNEKFAEIAHARDVLTDTKKREEYDRQRRRNARPESSNETKEGRRPHDRKLKLKRAGPLTIAQINE
ncbi:hypothetical protein RRF57_012513 [Xylaria bambusicola]|uniref:J domain-containing protein n=1 Tax=Xylaria bambusicola TaxID=326684 RepID=A0AAN7ZDQ7_9PEZI